MSHVERELLSHLIEAYGLPGASTLKQVTMGLIHQTYLIETPEGPIAVAQGLHPALSDDAILSDYDRVTSHLAQINYGGPELLKTLDGALASPCGGHLWRVSSYVEGETYAELSSDTSHAQTELLDVIRCGGRGIAEFHRAISALGGPFHSKHPGHNTRFHLERLRLTSELPQHAQAWSEIEEWGSLILDELSREILPDELPRQVVHGDPKISNLRFQWSLERDLEGDQEGEVESREREKSKAGRAVMIDLDTCNIHTRLVDLGDAIRDWCHIPEAIQGERFSVERCRALLEGYLSVADELTELERAWLPRAGRVIALELASRFAWDYLEDSYFAYDATRFPSRRAHNAVRMRDMYLLAGEMRAAADELAVWLDERTQ